MSKTPALRKSSRLLLLIIPFCLLLGLVSVPTIEAEVPSVAQAESVSESLFKHVNDSNEFEPLPFISPLELPFGLTVHRLMLILTVIIIVAGFLVAFWKPKIRPRRFALALEKLILLVRDDIVLPILGETRGLKWLPFFTSLFVFILVSNFIGLIPAFKTATGNLSVTTAMALIILVLIFVTGFGSLGFKGFFANLYPAGSPLPIGIFVALLELIGNFIKSTALSLRLFANMFAGHLAILSFVALMFIMHPAMGTISIPFALFTYALEILVAFIQAYVFTLLSCIFISMASTSHDHA